ncbi:hypothetical protein BDK51DRAFT_26967 [Blyttiomyces helicus]|uniref:F-box domain-containing protein n=1 Tax=Blyttiomyces helicus TaxID=388810 RepID=A0A4P9W8M1_9FUNG|nr:hypothetical protein BDK51DRAFT_26967 [Blyttiomyces helicus]|eukprot:RKO87805.1 hypothetical protein BDK51DRAFT_26967 [Blyttiomyces helicus]
MNRDSANGEVSDDDDDETASGGGSGKSRPLPMLPAEVLEAVMASTARFSDRRTLVLACCRVCKAWYHPARSALRAVLELVYPDQLPHLALAREALLRQPDNRQSPPRHELIFLVAGFQPRWPNVRKSSGSETLRHFHRWPDGFLKRYRHPGTIMGACDLIVFIWEGPLGEADIPDSDEDWATFKVGMQRRVLFDFADIGFPDDLI